MACHSQYGGQTRSPTELSLPGRMEHGTTLPAATRSTVDPDNVGLPGLGSGSGFNWVQTGTSSSPPNMVCCCAFPGCANRANSWSPYRFHRIPLADLHLRMLWLSVLRMDVNTPPASLKHLRVCSAHFTDDDYIGKRENSKGQLHLKDHAVPSFSLVPVETLAADTDPEVKGHGVDESPASIQKQTVILKTPRTSKPPKPQVNNKGAQNVLLIPRDPYCDVVSRWQLSVRARPLSDPVRLVFLQILNFAKLLHILSGCILQL